MKISAIGYAPRILAKKQTKQQPLNNKTELGYSYSNSFSMPYFKGGLFEIPIDARNRRVEVRMQPNTPYIINKNASLNLSSGYLLDLTNPIVEKRINSLEKSEKMIIGRDEVRFPGMDKSVSRRHLEIQNFGENELIVKDLNSLNGTTILPASNKQAFLFDYTNLQSPKYIPTDRAVRLPENCQIILGEDSIIDMRNPKIKALVDSNQIVEVGRSSKNALVINGFHEKTSRKHLRLQKHNGATYAQDLGSLNGSIFVPQKHIQPFYWGADKIELSQSNIGDCYLLASIYALSRNPYGAKILENMMTIDKDGNYRVRFSDGEEITVRQWELDGEISKDKKNDMKVSVQGTLELKALERAYAKKIRPPKDYGRTMYAKIDEGGYTPKALKDLAGLNSTTYCGKNQDLKEILKELSEEENQNSIILTCYTPADSIYGDYADKFKRFPINHAFTLLYNDPEYNEITVIDPHNTREFKTIPWGEFSEIFSHLIVTRI